MSLRSIRISIRYRFDCKGGPPWPPVLAPHDGRPRRAAPTIVSNQPSTPQLDQASLLSMLEKFLKQRLLHPMPPALPKQQGSKDM